MLISFRGVVLVLLLSLSYISGIPSQVDQQDGPCVGMNCLHGVLMHNDETANDEHKAEDQYLRFKEALETGEKPEIGTKATEDELHRMLMHDGQDAHHEHEGGEKQLLPEVVKETGPQDPNEFLHEAMHGEEGVMKHTWDDKKEDVPVLQEPLGGDKLMHDVLMHGGEAHVHEEKPADVVDTNDVLSGPNIGEELMHGVLMHGDKDHHHDAADEVKDITDSKPIQPLDAEGYLHGVLMHGDAETGKAHEHAEDSLQEGLDNTKAAGPNGDDLHGLLMHGDSKFGKEHKHEDEKEAEPFSDILEILNMELDEQLLRVIDIEKLLKKDMEEYAEWIKNNPEYQDETLSGSTNIEITDSILSDIELMKNKYLKTYNSEFDSGSSEDSSSDSEDSDEFPFTADDAKGVLDADAGEKGDQEDMRHYLELLGSTEPLNARHKVQLELLKKKLNKDG